MQYRKTRQKWQKRTLVIAILFALNGLSGAFSMAAVQARGYGIETRNGGATFDLTPMESQDQDGTVLPDEGMHDIEEIAEDFFENQPSSTPSWDDETLLPSPPSLPPALTEEEEALLPAQTATPTAPLPIPTPLPTPIPSIPVEEEALPPLLAEESALPTESPLDETSAEGFGRVLSQSAIIVYHYDELKRALSEDNGFDTIYFGADIAANAGGIVIHPNKESVIINGQSPDSGTEHRFTQWNSTAFANTIRVEVGSRTQQVTLRNLDITGQNYYGIVAVSDSVKGVEIVQQNVRYAGPQPIYNRNGSARISDSSYTLQAAGAISTQELAEVTHIEFGGRVTVDVGNSGYSVVWLTHHDSTLTIADHATLTVDTQNYFIFTSADANVPTVRVGSGAQLRVKSRNGFTYSLQKIGRFYVGENATIVIEQNTTLSTAALRIASLFQADPGSDITIVRTGTAGIALRLTDAGGRAEFTQPERVFLYSSAGVPLRGTGNGTLSISTSAINLWQASLWNAHDGVDMAPSHIWNKANNETLALTAALSSVGTSSVSHNLSADDPIVSALDAQNFNLEKNQLLAFGRMGLRIDPMTQNNAITGETEPGAELNVSFASSDGQSQNVRTTADGTGRYSVSLGEMGLSESGVVTVIAGSNRLQMRQRIVQGETGGNEDGRLAFLAVPDEMTFGVVPIPSEQRLVPKREQMFTISVGDNRLSPTAWRLDASIEQPLAAESNTGLLNAVVFADSQGSTIPLSQDPLTVYRELNGANRNYDIQWGENEGILLKIAPGDVYSDLDYQTTIHWSLVDAP